MNIAVALPSNLRKPRLNRQEAPAYLEQCWGIRVAAATLAKLASTGGGPKFEKYNRTPLYPTTELDAWAKTKLTPAISSTSEI